jgi:MYXO-CTERM domain-containing protein
VAALLGISACVVPPDSALLQQGAALDICATVPEGALCDDKNVCTVFDVCKAGVCKGSAVPDGTLCTDGNVCTINDSCRAGICKGDAVPELTACTDGDPCTVGDACKAGICLSGAGMLACNDGVACTLDVCVPGAGCVFAPVGDCNVPTDAGPMSDGKPPADTATDTMMSGGDVATDRSDGPGVPDAMTEAVRTDLSADVPPDAIATDAPPPVDAPIEDGGPPDAPAADGDVGAPDAADADAADVDASAPDAPAGADTRPGMDAIPVSTLPVLRASGGACACTAAEGSAAGSTLGALGLLAAMMMTLARRRTPRRGR